MKSRTDLVLKAAKEVAVKYIETGRLSLTSFPEGFAKIYETIDGVVPREDKDKKRDKKKD